MKFDVFFSLCQNEIEGKIPSERTVFQNFFKEVQLADQLGYEIAWIAESHLSSEVQKSNKNPVISDFKGEVGIHTDLCQMAHLIFSKTQNIELGSAIKNIFCNGGPLAHAESIKSFLSLNSSIHAQPRSLHVGYASGRFEYSIRPYGMSPRDSVEESFWKLVKSKTFLEAQEIFLKALRGDTFSSQDIKKHEITASDFPHEEAWKSFLDKSSESSFFERASKGVRIKARWDFETLKIIPQEAPIEHLSLITGSHDPAAHILANEILPCKVFNLSITPSNTIEDTHKRMQTHYHKDGGPWQRHYLPRTTLVFINADASASIQEQRNRAKERAQKALEVYWQAIEGTLDQKKVENAIENALCGCPEDIVEQIKTRFHPEDRLMLWFDFNCHDSLEVNKNMKIFAEKVIPKLG